jgi:hypothetical protein
MMRINHDCQYLFIQIHTLAIIYYMMKYISKTEDNTYSKLMIAAAVIKILITSKSDGQDEEKSMLIKTYNKLSSHHEIGIPEIISHLLDYSDALTSTSAKLHPTNWGLSQTNRYYCILKLSRKNGPRFLMSPWVKFRHYFATNRVLPRDVLQSQWGVKQEQSRSQSGFKWD